MSMNCCHMIIGLIVKCVGVWWWRMKMDVDLSSLAGMKCINPTNLWNSR